MMALAAGRNTLQVPNLRSWLRHAENGIEDLAPRLILNPELAPHNRLSQLNVLLQLEHLKSYPIVRERIGAGELQLHGWWFDISRADVYAFEESLKKFVIFDEEQAARILARG